MAHVTLKDHYDILLQEWAAKPLLGTHQIGDCTVIITHMRWSLSTTHGPVASGTIRSNKGAREAITKAVKSWLRQQLR